MAKDTDWERVELDYRAGQLSVLEIGRQNKISHTAINKRAKEEGWTRSLAHKVKAEFSARVASDGAFAETVSEAVSVAVETRLAIVREHRESIGRGRKIMTQLLDEAESVNAHIEDIEAEIEILTAEDEKPTRRNAMMRAVSLPNRAGTLLTLTTAMKTLIGMERTAFGMDDGEDNRPEPMNITVKLVG